MSVAIEIENAVKKYGELTIIPGITESFLPCLVPQAAARRRSCA